MTLQAVRQSRLFETAPELVTDQPTFLNAAVAVKTDQPPLQLLASLKGIEASTLSGSTPALPRPQMTD